MQLQKLVTFQNYNYRYKAYIKSKKLKESESSHVKLIVEIVFRRKTKLVKCDELVRRLLEQLIDFCPVALGVKLCW